MTITLQAVNELITSLESAGELSIREQKFLKLAKEFRICSASLDAAIKTGNMLADQNAQLAAENVAIREQSEEVYAAGYNHGHLNTVDGITYAGCVKDDFYGLALQVMAEVETPATDRIVAGIKADGVESGIKTIMVMLNHQAPGVSDAINVLRIYCSKLREVAKHD